MPEYFDEILLSAVLVMLIASTFMALKLQHSINLSRRALNVFIDELKKMATLTSSLDSEILNLKRRVKELEK